MAKIKFTIEERRIHRHSVTVNTELSEGQFESVLDSFDREAQRGHFSFREMLDFFANQGIEIVDSSEDTDGDTDDVETTDMEDVEEDTDDSESNHKGYVIKTADGYYHSDFLCIAFTDRKHAFVLGDKADVDDVIDRIKREGVLDYTVIEVGSEEDAEYER